MKLEIGPEANRNTRWRSRFSDEWTTMGISDKTELDIKANIDHLWPLEDGSCDALFASHVLEHVRDPVHFVREAYRVLAPGGLFRVSVPSARWYFRRYLSGKATLWDAMRNLRSWHGSPDFKAHWHAFDEVVISDLFTYGVYRRLGVPVEITTDSAIYFDQVNSHALNSSFETFEDSYFMTRRDRSIFCEGVRP